MPVTHLTDYPPHGLQLGEYGEHATPSLLYMFQKSSTASINATGHGQTVDLAAAKLNDLYGGGGGLVPRLDGPETFAGLPRAICTRVAAAPPPSSTT